MKVNKTQEHVNSDQVCTVRYEGKKDTGTYKHHTYFIKNTICYERGVMFKCSTMCLYVSATH